MHQHSVCEDCQRDLSDGKDGIACAGIDHSTVKAHVFSQDRRCLILQEIIETERRYVDDLEALSEAFVVPIMDALFEASKKNSKLITISRHRTQLERSLFGSKMIAFLNHIESITTLNSEFLEALESRISHWNVASFLGDVFLQYANLFKAYSEYAQIHTRAISQLTSSLKLRTFLKICCEDPLLKHRTIESFMILPIQRIPRYELFLKEMLKLTEPDNLDDYRLLRNALEEVNETAVYINEAIRCEEDRVLIQDLEAKFETEVHLIKANRRFLKSGSLLVLERSGRCRSNIVILFSDLLILCLEQSRRYKLVDSFSIEEVIVIKNVGHDRAEEVFSICSPKCSYLLFAESSFVRNSWIDAFSNAMDDFAARSSDGDLSEDMIGDYVPVWIPDSERSSCKSCANAFSLLNRRHHCRSCGILLLT